MRVLLDTDIVLDLLLQRAGFVQAAVALFETHERGEIQAHISALTSVNVFYIARKTLGQAPLRRAIEQLLLTVTVCPMDAQSLRGALALPMADFEDATQVTCALRAGLEAIVTRNLSDYQNSPLPVYSPAQLLAYLAQP